MSINLLYSICSKRERIALEGGIFMKKKVSRILFITIISVIFGIGGFFAGLSISDAVIISGYGKIT